MHTRTTKLILTQKKKKKEMRTFHNTRTAYTVITIINITLAIEYTSIKQKNPERDSVSI